MQTESKMSGSFDLDEYIRMKRNLSTQSEGEKESVSADPEKRFNRLCSMVESFFEKEWEGADDVAKINRLELEKKAIMGFPSEMNWYKERIREFIKGRGLEDTPFPKWYPDLVEAVFAENLGLSGLAPWAYDMEERFKRSSSAKLIGDRLYLLIDGRSELQPQRIGKKRREKLKRALLLATPSERLEYGFHEVYLQNGIRITIYSGERTKENQDVMVFRKYILKDYRFETLAELGTIPYESIPLFESMIKCGFNVLFAGQVRSGKTTFMQIWQSMEDTDLEGLAVSTDPETPWHEIMPKTPIMQITADGKDLERLNKSLLRGDNDYIILEEMRDGVAFRLALDITSTGTSRCKGTIHERDPVNIPYRMASKIRSRYGGDFTEICAQVFKNFDYVIELTQKEENRGKKVMKSIVEYSYDIYEDRAKATYICKYNFDREEWVWNGTMSDSFFLKYGERREDLEKVRSILFRLSKGEKRGKWTISPSYYHNF